MSMHGSGGCSHTKDTRLAKAVGIIAMLATAVFLVENVYDGASANEGDLASPQSSLTLEALMADSTFDGVQHDLPDGFTEEVLSLDAYSEIYVSEDRSSIGLVSPAASVELFDAFSEELDAHGWTRVESGHNTLASFIKQDGRFNWLFLSCTPVGDESTVLIQMA